MKFKKILLFVLIIGVFVSFAAGNILAQTKSIVETAIEAGSFNPLVQAVQAAGLVDVLSGPGPFTVFAPTDAAFAKVPASVLNGYWQIKNN